MINGFSAKQIAACRGRNREIAKGWDLPIRDHISSLPPHLVDSDHQKAPEPANGKSFEPAGQWWYDPVTGEPFQSNGFGYFEGFAVVVRERPGHGLLLCERTSELTASDLESFIRQMWQANRFWPSHVCHLLKTRGVRITGQTHVVDPEEAQIYAVENFNKAVRADVKAYLEKLLEDPDWLIEENEKEAILELRKWSRERRAAHLEDLRKKGKMSLEQELTDRWSKISAKAKAGGLASGKVQELFQRVCKDLGVEVGLAPEPLDKLESAIDAELGIISHQTSKADDIQEKARLAEQEVFGTEKPPIAYTELMRSAQKYGITHEQIAEWAAEVKSTVEYSPELINHLNVKIAQVLAGDVVTVESQDLPEGEDEETGEAETVEKPVVAEPAPVEKNAKAEPTEEKAPAKRAKRAKAEKVEGLSSLELTLITNPTSGEVKTLNKVMEQRFNLLTDKAAIEQRIKMYAEQQQAKLNEIESSLTGWEFCYGAQVAEVVREQFIRNRKPDGKYKPATIKTEFATFSRNPDDLVKCIDPAKFQDWAVNVPEAERCFYGDAIVVEVKGSKKGAKALVLAGTPVDGWIKVENPDEIGVPKIGLSNSSVKIEDSESDESEVPTEGDQAA